MFQKNRYITASITGYIFISLIANADERKHIIEPQSHSNASINDMSLEDINTQLENPLTSLWSLTFENTYKSVGGDSVNDSTSSNVLNFQPGMPLPLPNNYTFIARPGFPMITNPVVDPVTGDVEKHTTGFGDIQMLSLIGPDKSKGFVWGLGTTMKFPTASGSDFGAGKWQAGPSLMLFNFGEQWTVGLLGEHWWSFAGDNDRAHTNETNIKYIIRHKLPNAWSIGAGPTVKIDWKEDSDNRLTFPVGLGVSTTRKWGSLPVKFRLEGHYNVTRPDNYGDDWSILFRIAPVLRSPFSQ